MNASIDLPYFSALVAEHESVRSHFLRVILA